MANVAILVENKYEDLEVQYPRLRLLEAGHKVDLVGPHAGDVYMGKWGYPQKATHAAGEVRPSSYDLIMVPGGMAPDFMRRDGGMIHFMRDAVAGQKPLAAICHGLWMLCSTDVLKGRRCTSFFAVAHDVANAGGRWVDEECVVDGSLITSRCPDDLPAFMSAVLEQLAGETPKGRKGHPIAPAWLAGTLAAESRG